MNFELLNEKTRPEETYGSPRNTRKASRARRLVVWGMLLLGSAALAASTTGCSKEQTERKELERKDNLKNTLRKRIENAIKDLMNHKIKSIDILLGISSKEGVEINNDSDTDDNLSIGDIYSVIDEYAEKHPDFTFAIEIGYGPFGYCGERFEYVLEIGKRD